MGDKPPANYLVVTGFAVGAENTVLSSVCCDWDVTGILLTLTPDVLREIQSVVWQPHDSEVRRAGVGRCSPKNSYGHLEGGPYLL